MGQHGIGHRHIDKAALAAALGVEQCGHDGESRGHGAAQQVGDLETQQGRRAANGLDLLGDAGVAQVVDVVAGVFAIGAGLAVAGDRAKDDLRVDCLDGFIADAQLLHYPRAKAFDDDLRGFRQAQESGDAFGLFQVEEMARLLRLMRTKKSLIADSPSPWVSPMVRA